MADYNNVREAGKVCLHWMDNIDRLFSELGEDDLAWWWYELRNELKPVFDWMVRYGKVPPSMLGEVAPTEPDDDWPKGL